MPARTDIFGFLDLAEWLTTEFAARRTDDPTLTHRAFSALCGYKSSGAMSLITSGRRRMSRAAADRVAKSLGLDPAEREHMRRMVAYALAESFEERADALDKMTAAKQFASQWKGTIESYEFYRDWTLPVIRELVSLPDFREDAGWVAGRLHNRVPPARAKKALERLEELGYLDRGADGTLRLANPIVATPSEVRSDTLKHFQREMMRLAAEALDSQPSERRDMRVITMAISQNQADTLKAMLTQFHKDVLATISEDEPIETVYQLNTQLFALTDMPDQEGDP